LRSTVILYVEAVPEASSICISSFNTGDAGRVNVLAAEVFTKYLLPFVILIFEDTSTGTHEAPS
jgi:hypothetical protein